MKLKALSVVLCIHIFLVLVSYALANSPTKAKDKHSHLQSLGPAPIMDHARLKRSLRDEEGESPPEENRGNRESNNSDKDGGQTEDDSEDDINHDSDDQDEDISDSKNSPKVLMDTLSYVKDGGALHKDMSESAELAKELGSVFELLTQREVSLHKDMRGLTEALNRAVINLKQSLEEGKIKVMNDELEKRSIRNRRHFNYNYPHPQGPPIDKNPYKACVSIEPAESEDIRPENYGAARSSNLATSKWGPTVQEYIPGKTDPVIDKSLVQPEDPQNEPVKPGEVDLSQVYWVRLNPDRKKESLHKTVDTLLNEKQKAGRDVLVIPVSHGFKNTDDVKSGFLRAVRVRPKALKSTLFRQLRSLKIMEL